MSKYVHSSMTWVVALLLLASQVSFAQNAGWKSNTSGKYKYSYVPGDPLQSRFYTLPNGLKVITTVNKKEPRIQALIAVRAGSNTDPKNHTGLAHYLEHMLFKGTNTYGSLDWSKEKPLLDQIEALYEKYNKTTDPEQRTAIYKEIDRISGEAAKFAIPNEYDKMMSAMGAQGTNAHTWVEETVYEEDVPTNALERFFTVQAERFRQPVLRLFHTELEAVYEEKNRTLDNDGRKVFYSMMEAMFPTHNYGQQSTIGTIEHLKNPSLTEIQKFYNTYYVPNNMAVILAGDFDPDYVVGLVEKHLGFMKNTPVKEYTAAPEAPITAPIVREVYGPTPENISIGFRLPGALDEKSAMLANLVDEILSNGKAGLIDLNLNKQQKLLGGSSNISIYKDYSVARLNGSPKAGQTLDEVKQMLLSQLDLLRKGQFEESLIKATAANYKLGALQGAESNNYRANMLMSNYIQTKGDGWPGTVGFIDAMSKVTKKELVEFANKYYGDNYVVVYKRQGEDKSIVKVDKPTITPITLNRDVESDFAKKVNNMPLKATQPEWIDFKKAFQQGKMGVCETFYVQNTENDLFRLSYRFDMGNWNDRRLGMASQYLQFLSTDKYTAEQISQAFYDIACNYNFSVQDETATISISGLREHFGKAVEMVEHLFLNCKPDEAALESLKGRLMKARADAKLNRNAIRSALSSYGLYGPKNPFNSGLTDEQLKNLTASDLVSVLNGIFQYPHQIIYYGPETQESLQKQLKMQHRIPEKAMAYPAAAKFKHISQDKNQILFAHYDMVQAELNWVRNTTNYDPAMAPVIDLFNSYFGGGMGTIVFQTIRESKALAYSTFAFYQTPYRKEQPYSFNAYVGTQADKLEDAINGMNELIADMPEVPIVLDQSKQNMKKTYESERISQDGPIYSYLEARRKGLDYDLRKSIYGKLDQLTMADVKAFHKSNIAGKPYTYCLVASKDKVNLEMLKKYGEVKELSLTELFGY